MKSKIKDILSSILFVTILLILFNLTSNLFTPKGNDEDSGIHYAKANGILGERKNSIDVLIIGDSESYTGFVPLKLWELSGVTSFVCGTPAQKLPNSEEFLHKAFKNQRPKVVVMETNAIFRKVSFDDVMVHNLSRVYPVFQYHNRWKNLKLHDFNFKVHNKYMDKDRGYQYNNMTKAIAKRDYMKKTSDIREVPERNSEIIKRMKEFCEKNNAKFILVSSPSLANWNYEKHNGIQKLANELKIPYLDMNLFADKIGIDWTKDTRDEGDHLNHRGALKTTKYLAEHIRKMFKIEDKRKNPNLKNWNIDAHNFNKKVKS